jgi:hypothetical protein
MSPLSSSLYLMFLKIQSRRQHVPLFFQEIQNYLMSYHVQTSAFSAQAKSADEALHDWPRAPAAPSQATALEAHVRLCLCLSTYRKSYTMTMDSWTCACATLTHSKQRSSTSCPAFSLPPLLKSSLLLRYAPPAF